MASAGTVIAGSTVIAVERDELAVRIGVECAVARVEGVAVGADHLEPAPPVERQIEAVSRLRQRALLMQIADGRRAHAKADLGAFRNGFSPPRFGTPCSRSAW